MSTKEKAKTADTDEATAKGGKKKLIVIVLVVLLAAGAAAYFLLFSGSAKAAAPVPGSVVKLDPVAVNLAGGGYLRIGVALQLTADADA
jgi:flagellar FliL protein